MNDGFADLAQAVIEGQPQRVVDRVRAALAQGADPIAMFDVLVSAIREVGDRFGCGDYFLPDLMLGAEAMQAGTELLEDELASKQLHREVKARIILGTVEGDLHDIGKSLVGLMLKSAGSEVIDLGANVPNRTFLSKITELNPDVVGMSTLLTTTLSAAQQLIASLKEAGVRDQFLVIVGGAATTQSWAENAADAVALVDRLVGSRR